MSATVKINRRQHPYYGTSSLKHGLWQRSLLFHDYGVYVTAWLLMLLALIWLLS